MVLFNPKCKTLFVRDSNLKVTHELKDERYGLINRWLITRKMDGMSVILSITPDNSTYYGRTANTDFNEQKANFLGATLESAKANLFNSGSTVESVDIYAELVGPECNGNPYNLTEFSLHVFDMRINDFWLDWHNVVDIARSAGLDTVEVLDKDINARQASAYAQEPEIFLGDEHGYFEGIVARTDPYVYDNQGKRLMWKLKVSDYRR